MTARVLIIDDSALMRGLLENALNGTAGVEVLGTAPDASAARGAIKSLKPNVLTLDIEMPGLSGLEFLEEIMTTDPMPVIMVSTLTGQGTDSTLKALELGAIDFIEKPVLRNTEDRLNFKSRLSQKVKSAATARVSKPLPQPVSRPQWERATGANRAGKPALIAIGASTGGVTAVKQVLEALPPDCPPVAIVQHMPPAYTARFANRLNASLPQTVKEAIHGETLKPGTVHLGPGGRHLSIRKSSSGYITMLSDDPPVNGHRPSVDVFFQSVAKAAGPSALGTILTGMGRDGADGLLMMRKAGASTFGEAEESCVVYGMPKAAFQIGAVAEQLPVNSLSSRIASLL